VTPATAQRQYSESRHLNGGSSSPHRRRKRSRWIPSFEMRMMLPAMVPLALLSVIPLGYIIWMSVSKVTLIGGVKLTGVGGDNWVKMFHDPAVSSSWGISALYFISTVGIEMFLGVGIALLVHERILGRNLLVSVLLMPMFVAPVIVGLLGRFLTDSSFGLYTWVLRLVGIHVNVFGTPEAARWTVVALDAWEWTPLIMLITLAGLSAVPKALIEAASLDGAGYFKRLWHVVIPSISGVLAVALLIRSMDAIRFFDIIWITTNGGPADATKIIPLRLYEIAFRFFDLGYAAVIGLTMLLFSIIVANVFVSLLQKKSGAGH
jgi:multiple sugar transport system permease protein